MTVKKTIATILLGLMAGGPALADDEGKPRCSVRRLAGRWMFFTGVGQLPAFGGDITALGTMEIKEDGTIGGVFDATIATTAFLEDVTYGGTVTVQEDCRGVLTFTNSAGATRTDSLVVLGDGEMRGMSRDIGNLWTYEVRRIAPRPKRSSDDR
jgi:hypothetical protein